MFIIYHLSLIISLKEIAHLSCAICTGSYILCPIQLSMKCFVFQVATLSAGAPYLLFQTYFPLDPSFFLGLGGIAMVILLNLIFCINVKLLLPEDMAM